MERRKILKYVQVLKDMKVKFVSALGVRLWASFCIQLWFFSQLQILLSYSWAGGEKTKVNKQTKKSLLTISLPSRFCRSSWILQAEGGWAPFFFLSCGTERMGALSGLQYSQVPSLQPLSLIHI